MGKAYNKYYNQESLRQGPPMTQQTNVGHPDPPGDLGPSGSPGIPAEEPKPTKSPSKSTKKEAVKRPLYITGCKELNVRKTAQAGSEVLERIKPGMRLETTVTPVELAKLKDDMFVQVSTDNNPTAFVMRKFVKLGSKEV